MKMRAGIVEGAIADGSANDDDIVIFKIQNPAFVGLKLVFGKSANPPLATVTDGFAMLPGGNKVVVRWQLSWRAPAC